jgi:hypothetical protein
MGQHKGWTMCNNYPCMDQLKIQSESTTLSLTCCSHYGCCCGKGNDCFALLVCSSLWRSLNMIGCCYIIVKWESKVFSLSLSLSPPLHFFLFCQQFTSLSSLSHLFYSHLFYLLLSSIHLLYPAFWCHSRSSQ